VKIHGIEFFCGEGSKQLVVFMTASQIDADSAKKIFAKP
jgi:hypothetical protein